MADLPQQDTIKQYVADGVSTGYVATFYVPLETDGEPNIQVYVTPAGDTPIPESDIQVWGVDFTYTPNLDPITGGTVNFLTGSVPANGDVVTLVRDVQASLDVEFSNAQTFNGQNLDDALDKLLLIEQQNKTYALQRNLSYVVNSYLPDSTRTANVQIPLLESQQVWMGSAGGVIAATLEQNPDVSTLRSELANASPGTDGARLIGYWDTILLASTTVNDFLTNRTFRLIGVQKITATGTYTPTTGTKWCWARGVGGGGGGGGSSSLGGNHSVAAGGSAGAYGEKWFEAATYACVIGAAGAGGAIGATGGSGGQTSLGNILILGGGLGGLSEPDSSADQFATAQVGGTPTAGDFTLQGNAGNWGIALATGGISGKGADSPLGAGGLSRGGGTPNNGIAATGYGAGGSGGLSYGAISNTGGAGAPGILVIFEFG